MAGQMAGFDVLLYLSYCLLSSLWSFNIVSLDPGVRTFQTLYSPNGIVGKIGDNFCNDRLIGIAKRIDELDSIASNSEWKTRRNIRNRQSLLRTKIKNKVKDLHWKTCSYLVRNYKNIMIPILETHRLSLKNGRNIGKKTTRNMLTLSHYSFLEKLKMKCNEYNRNLWCPCSEFL